MEIKLALVMVVGKEARRGKGLKGRGVEGTYFVY